MANIKGISPPTWIEQLLQQATVITVGYLNQHFSSASENLPVSKLQCKLDLGLSFPFQPDRKKQGETCVATIPGCSKETRWYLLSLQWFSHTAGMVFQFLAPH